MLRLPVLEIVRILFTNVSAPMTKVITTGGYREPITLPQIRTNLEMDSHEEKLHRMIKQSKMDQAKDQAKEAAKTIKDKLK